MAIDKSIFMLCKSMTEEEIKTIDTFNLTANIKYDGERILAIKDNDTIILFNRGGNIVNTNFREVAEDLKQIEGDFILDGEIISRDDDFTKLMTRARVTNKERLKQREIDVKIKYMIFDILVKDKKEMFSLKLSERLEELKQLLLNFNSPNVEIAEYGDVNNMFDRAKNEKREGIIIKNINGFYECGKRSDFWVKVKFFKEEVFTAINYEENPKGIKVIDKLGRSVQISGEQHKEVKDILEQKGEVDIEIQYLTKSSNGNYRFPSYKRTVGQP
jgi:ATP-dependent DNA ligase